MPFLMSGKESEGKSGFVRRSAGQKADDSQKMSNIFKNAIRPISSGPQIKGTLTYVALEVAVSKLLRTIMKADSKTVAELAVVHSISLGLMGGTGAALNNPSESVLPYGEKSSRRQIMQGAKGIPALYLAQYIYQTFFNGFSMTFWSVKDALIMAAAKILTRPIAAKLYGKNKFLQNSLDAQQFLEWNQNKFSNFRRIPDGDRYQKPSN